MADSALRATPAPRPPGPDAPGFYEFFAGGGMARAGLGPGWRCLFANDNDAAKGLSYQANWGVGGELRIADVRALQAADLPGRADLAWASFPCQDLSLAGAGAGLGGERSGAFHPFWSLVTDLAAERRAPAIVALENVCGTLSSHGGRDFAAICSALARTGYRCGALVIDAELFVPQSRPRLFVAGVREEVAIDPALLAPGPVEPFHTRALRTAVARLPGPLADGFLWWNLPTPPRRASTFADLLDPEPDGVAWRTEAETAALVAQMSPAHLAKLAAATRSGRPRAGGVYRRTRRDAEGARVQRAEVRFDDVAGCLRTPAGGSSRQLVLVVDGDSVRSRLLSPRETARLMGLPDSYRLPRRTGAALHLTGDGVVAPVVSHLARHLFEPLLRGASGVTSLVQSPSRSPA